MRKPFVVDQKAGPLEDRRTRRRRSRGDDERASIEESLEDEDEE